MYCIYIPTTVSSNPGELCKQVRCSLSEVISQRTSRSLTTTTPSCRNRIMNYELQSEHRNTKADVNKHYNNSLTCSSQCVGPASFSTALHWPWKHSERNSAIFCKLANSSTLSRLLSPTFVIISSIRTTLQKKIRSYIINFVASG